ncbi:MAG: hypothetical protein U9R56_07595 [candidate division Zixibacteria bacterium]|nr:hypothetical protein [candidate division Zixibacteria bacterium]
MKSLSGIEVKTSVDRADMLIGDLINYKLTIIYDSTYELVPPPLGANLGAFDVKDFKPDMVSQLPDGRMKSETDFILSTFTTGEYIIPPVPIIFSLPDGSRKLILSESVPIKVNSLLENEGDSVDIRGLKDPYEFERDLTAYYIWGSLILVVLVVAGMMLWRRLKKKKGDMSQVDLRPPWEIAFEKLAVLKEKKLIESGQFKLYYFELTEIIRYYLGRMYDVDAMEMTTEEFLERFSEIALPADLYNGSRTFFYHADLVKFAKYVPESSRTEEDYNLVHDMLESVRSDCERKRQAESAHVPSGNPDAVMTGSADKSIDKEDGVER